jgi:hypothetical protein
LYGFLFGFSALIAISVSIDGLQMAPKPPKTREKYRHPKIGMPTRIFLKGFQGLDMEKYARPDVLTVSAEIACWARSRETVSPPPKWC